jgi:hypothetical protein
MSHRVQLSEDAVPACAYLKAQITNGQTLTGAWVKIAFDSPIFNDCFTEASDVFTCTKAGWYQIGLTTYQASSLIQQLRYRKNATADSTLYSDRSEYLTGSEHMCLHKLVRLSVGDTIEIQAYITSTATGLVGGDDLRTLYMVRVAA